MMINDYIFNNPAGQIIIMRIKKAGFQPVPAQQKTQEYGNNQNRLNFTQIFHIR